uniref:Reverse transcriptase domain-containing protein n=1 Tax=Tanacetum cinerariifolium TaxID=118510 RepID=A0A699HHP9_TANCI|nr:reverse transcriptase domain-containing protein [Tanacetum cinerariifolium]
MFGKPLIVNVEVEGHLVRRVFVDQGAAVKVMFEHCFDKLCPSIKARLTETHTELVGFFGIELILIGKIQLEVSFRTESLYRRTLMKFTVVRAALPYNIILGRNDMRELRDISSIIHAMMKFLTPQGIATLVTRTSSIFKCRRANDHHWEEVLNEIQITTDKFPKKEHGCIRMAPSDMTGVPKRVIKNSPKHQHVYSIDGTKKKGLRLEKEPSGGKRGAMYQRQVNTAFQSHLGRNLKAYVDDMVIKSKTKQEMPMDITETFDYLHRINMKLNPKKCFLGVEEGKFLGYMVTLESIWENLKRTKAVVDMRSLRTPKEMQSLSGVYDIMYVPQNAIKGQVLKDFPNETPIDTKELEKCNLSNGEVALEEWTLYIDRASFLKCVGASLVLIDPSRVGYTSLSQLLKQ